MKVLVHVVAIKLMYQNLIWNEDDNVHGKVVKHLNEFHPLSDHQWGFRPGKSTTHALFSATNEWFKILDDGADVGAIFSICPKHLIQFLTRIFWKN